VQAAILAGGVVRTNWSATLLDGNFSAGRLRLLGLSQVNKEDLDLQHSRWAQRNNRTRLL
jgi:hypothetical protein